ncbi:MAG: low molecular weight phosphatase family protein [Candidatus Marsarchaeota archaeon]|jgi:protein-tyrosine-phosphatase|nr:low molecular weight phosphatase family protein [Candidatus Marsarchaeota archaeon]MCL5419174.1 low molecular weight phosphatase family protein [Candidatus Marsarchaeota archaeon]
MKVLFICKANVGRSQMAEAIFNSLANSKAISSSAGVDPGSYEGKRIVEAGPNVTACMKDIGLDVSDKVSKKLTESMANDADIIVAMVSKNMLPSYLQSSAKLILWDIKDPKFMDYTGHVEIRNQIYEKVKELVKELNLN